MGCLFEDIIERKKCVYWQDDGCREPEINCGNSDALCNEMIWKQEIKITEMKKKLKECGKYAKIIKIGLEKNDARLLEAEQIERMASEVY